MLISVIIPTVTGREASLARCLQAYERTTRQPHETIIVTDQPTCGIAWQIGLRQATGTHLHLTADDLEPHEGWADAALWDTLQNRIPCPTVLEPDGRIQSTHGVSASAGVSAAAVAPGQVVGFTTVPFLTRQQWEHVGHMIDLHYCTDAWVSHRARLHGVETVACPSYRLTHWNEPTGRGAGMGSQDARTIYDRQRYEEMVA